MAQNESGEAAEEVPSPSSEQDHMDSPHGWRSGLGLRRKAKAFVKQHLDEARKIIEESLHNIGDKIVSLQGPPAITETSKGTTSEDELSAGKDDDTSECIKSTPASQEPDAPQETSSVEILGPLSKDVQEKFEGAKKILKSSMASIGDTAGSLLRFKPDNEQSETKESANDETSIEPKAPQPPPSPRTDESALIIGDESESGQKNVWGPIRKALDGIVQPSQQIGKHLIQVWDLHDLVDDLKEQRNLWRKRKAKTDSKESDSKESEASGEDVSQEDASQEEPASEAHAKTEHEAAKKKDGDAVFLY